VLTVSLHLGLELLAALGHDAVVVLDLARLGVAARQLHLHPLRVFRPRLVDDAQLRAQTRGISMYGPALEHASPGGGAARPCSGSQGVI
jgi:hypothetical protein